MKAILETPAVKVELEASTPKDLFKLIAETQEVFAEKCCGRCQSVDIRYVVRTVDKYDFYEVQCQDCGAKLVFGQSATRQGHLFPVRKLLPSGKPDWKDGEFDRDHHGWTMYRGDGEEPPATKAPNANGQPKSKDELQSRLKEKERAMVAAGQCKAGELFAAAEKGAGLPWSRPWTEHNLRAAFATAAAFVRDRTEQKAGAA